MRKKLITAPEDHFITRHTPGRCTITGYTGPGGDIVIPWKIGRRQVVEIDCGAFAHCASLTSVVIPDSITVINDEAFRDCSSLTSVTIPDSITAIGDEAFCNCSSLTSVVIPERVRWLGWNAFRGCAALTSVVIKKGVAIIQSGAFRGCTALTSVVIPDSVIEIRKFAFCRCTSLTSVVLPNRVRLICHGAFQDCTSLTSIVIPETVARIQPYAFDGCPALTLQGEAGSCAHHYALRNDIPFALPEGNSVPELFHAVLPDRSGCMIVGCITSAEAVHIPASINGLPVVKLGDHAFCNCSSLTSVVIPDSVKKIVDYAFRDCTALTSVVIPYSVTKISKSAFDGCDGLPVHVRESISAFRNFTRMRTPDGCTIIRYTGPGGDVIIPGEIGGTKVVEIDWFAFAGCSAVTSVVIPDSVTKIGYNAFRDCPTLTLRVREGSCAHRYAIDQSIPFELL